MSERQKTIAKFTGCFILLLIAYIPMFQWMIERWMAKESYYGHGPLIPIVSLFIMWQKRDALKGLNFAGERAGLAVIVAGLLVHIICAALKVYFVSGFSFVFVIYGLALFFFGSAAARHLRFPIFFLLTMIPLPLVIVGNLTVRLKLFAAQCATVILNRIGFPSVRDGSLIIMPNSNISIEAPCSGLRSLISLLTLGLIFAYFIKVSRIKKIILFLSSAPIAIATNVVRILILSTVNDLYGEKIAMGFVHDSSGFVVFALAFLSLMWVAKILEGKHQ